jgi:serine/threonine-protein kinase
VVHQIFNDALECDGHERALLLDRACNGDPSLRKEVDSLIAAHERAGGFLKPPMNAEDEKVPGPAKPDEARAFVWQSGESSAAPGTIDEGRFPSGTILAQRYRIVALLGRGGMGEVYRSHDLLLGQPVALKFLPRSATASEAALGRFRNEARTARQVSHPNVCRIYDIGEAEGLTYLTMEYVDGEDLAALLRRIGKLPQEKALEIARKLCAGLAAAHDKGVIHRDLKPANIMLDSQGQVRITDFGLAALAEHVRDVRSGTPAYMAPEQRAGREVTTRSDIYALGIVLHELFTGKRPSAKKQNTEMDPAVERVILRCLEQDPLMRPATALSVAAALPGGDPLAAALAAGETPSAELVANAGPVEGLRVPVAVACIVAVIVGLGALFFFRQKSDIVNQLPMRNSPEVLVAKAREIATSLGYGERSVNNDFGWEYNTDYLRYTAERNDALALQSRIKTNRPPVIFFWYRESPYYVDIPRVGLVTPFDPNSLDSAMLAVVLDSEGRLIEFHAQPQADMPNKVHKGSPDWERLFAAAQLDTGRFTQAEPMLTPRSFSDVRMTWAGSIDDSLHDLLRVEAAGYEGRPVFFKIVGPWSRSDQPPVRSLAGFPLSFALFFVIVLPIAAVLLAWRNARLARGDRRGAFRLAFFAFFGTLLSSLLGHNHVATFTEVGVLFSILRDGLFVAAVFWVLYVAFEPYVRRRSPAALISWSRLLAGRFRDPVVGSDVLAGIVLAVVGQCVVRPLTSPLITQVAPHLMSSTRASLAVWSAQAVIAVFSALSYMFFVTVVLLLAPRQWLAVTVFTIVLWLVSSASPIVGANGLLALRWIFLFWLVWFALTKFGVLTAAALAYVHGLSNAFPLTTNESAWYANDGFLVAATILALAAYGFYMTLAGRPLWHHILRDV